MMTVLVKIINIYGKEYQSFRQIFISVDCSTSKFFFYVNHTIPLKMEFVLTI